MKTPDSRSRFQAPSRHYHRHQVDDTDEAWSRWIGGDKQVKRPGRFKAPLLWVLAIMGFLGLLGAMCYQMF